MIGPAEDFPDRVVDLVVDSLTRVQISLFRVKERGLPVIPVKQRNIHA